MADYGLYSALRGTDDWSMKRQDAALSMNIAKQREQDAQQALQGSMQMEEGMNSAFDALSNLDVLPEDVQRMQDLERNARKSVIAGIARHKGDLKAYMASGGISDVHKYKSSVLNSQEYKNAMSNKANLKQYIDDRSKGNFINSTLVDVPTVVDGKEVIQPQRISMQQQLKLFQEGKIDKLNYGGSEKKIDLGIEDFNKMIKDPLNPYSDDNIVTMSNLYEKALSKGASEEQAKFHAQQYENMINAGGDSWRWNAGDKNARDLGWAKYNQSERHFQQTRADKKAEKSSGLQRLNIIGNRKAFMQPGQENPMSSPEIKMWTQQLGLRPLKDSPNGGKYKFLGDAMSLDGKTTIPMADGEIISEPRYRKGPDGKMYAVVTASFDDDSDAITDNGWFVDNLRPGLERTFGNLDSSFWNLGMGGRRTGEVAIPIDHFIEDEQTRSVMNDVLNVGNNLTNNPADFSDQAEMNTGNEFEQLYRQFESQYGKK